MVIVHKERLGTKSPVYQAWKKIYVILEALGADGMSSEESDNDELGHPCLKVNNLEWRIELSWILSKVDNIRAAQPQLFRSAGAPTKKRVPSGQNSKRTAPAKLPRSLYKQSWLNSRSKHQIDLDIQPSSAHLSFPDAKVVAEFWA